MKFKKLFSLILLLSMTVTSQAALIPGGPNVTTAGRTFTDVGNLIVLQCHVDVGSTKCSFRRAPYSAGYTPSGAKTFHVEGISSHCVSTGCTGSYINITYTDNDVGYQSSTASTNQVVLYDRLQVPPSNIYGYLSYPLEATVPNGKYLTVAASLAQEVDVFVYGYER